MPCWGSRPALGKKVWLEEAAALSPAGQRGNTSHYLPLLGMATGNRDTEGKGPKRGGGGEQQGGRRKRTVYSKEQVDILIKAFQSHPYPSYCMREKLARMMGLQESRLHVWFQNRRARQPKKPSGTSDANKCQNLPAPNFCPPGQSPEMQSSATVAAPNPADRTSSLPGRNWHLDSHSMRCWESHEASFHYPMSHLNYNQATVIEGMVPTQAFSSPSVQWQEAAQEEAYPVGVYEHPLQETTHYSTNWLGAENGLVRNSLELVLQNDQPQWQTEGANCYFYSTFQH